MAEYPAQFRLWLHLYNKDAHFGPGVVILLEQMRAGKSLRAASAALKMSYSKAFHLLAAAEADLGFALVERAKGGEDRAGMELTPQGAQMLDFYHEFEQRVNAAVQEIFCTMMSRPEE